MTLRKARNRIRIALDLPAFYLKAATEHGFHPLAAGRSLYAAVVARYTPTEAYKLGLLRPGADARTDHRFLSKSAMSAIQRRLNPATWELLLADKSIFYRYCEAAGLPIPSLLGIFLRPAGGWSAPRGVMTIEEDWIRFFQDGCPHEVVVKPSMGAYGRGVRILERRGNVFLENGKRTLDPKTLVHELKTKDDYRSFVIQKRIRNHHAITALSGSEGLQTARVFTVVTRDGTVRIIYAFFKVIVGENAIDNFVSGATGNLVVRIRVADGTLYPAKTLAPGGGLMQVPAHPVTGARFDRFQLPCWPEVNDIVRSAARLFLPLRSVGWDVAITPEGAVIIEGNHSSDPPTAGECMDEFLADLLRP